VARLVTLRRAAGVSLEEIARRMRASVMTVRRIERGEVLPNLDTAERYALAIGVGLCWELQDLTEEIAEGTRVGQTVDVDWGLDEPMAGTVVGVHGAGHRVWVQVQLNDGPIVDVPADAVKARPRRTRQR
jgi:transcriptional regulator with XRE-family HTH domain